MIPFVQRTSLAKRLKVRLLRMVIAAFQLAHARIIKVVADNAVALAEFYS